jgi:hypothetical protein
MIFMKVDQITENKAIELYNKGFGTVAIGRLLNRHRGVIQQILIHNNIELRAQSPRYHYDITFFDTYTPESCYWAGFIMADGYIKEADEVGIKLATKDANHLKKFVRIIKSNYIVRHYKNTGKIKSDYSYIGVSGKWFKTALAQKFNIYRCKSLTCKYPLVVPQQMNKHFIRGLIDGDGGICLTHVPIIHLTGTIDMLTTVAYIFKKELDIQLISKNEIPPINLMNKSVSDAPVGQISYSGKNAYKIANWLYSDSSNLTRLTRKYRRFKQYFKQYV